MQLEYLNMYIISYKKRSTETYFQNKKNAFWNDMYLHILRSKIKNSFFHKMFSSVDHMYEKVLNYSSRTKRKLPMAF